MVPAYAVRLGALSHGCYCLHVSASGGPTLRIVLSDYFVLAGLGLAGTTGSCFPCRREVVILACGIDHHAIGWRNFNARMEATEIRDVSYVGGWKGVVTATRGREKVWRWRIVVCAPLSLS